MNATDTPVPVVDPIARVRDAYRRIADVDRPEIWISLRPEADALAEAEAIGARLREKGSTGLPLAGLVIAVKDNIDVAGFPTTAALPSSAYTPDVSATAVARLENAGAIVIGKTNLDQLATGLVGSRSPFGAVRAAFDPTKISGGSSSGSAVAVALGIVDAALGTDTAGSGRVPAAFNRLIGIKPTLGLIPTRGVVPAAPSYDTITVFAQTLGRAELIAGIMTGADDEDPTSRPWPTTAPLVASPILRVAVPRAADLEPMAPTWRAAFIHCVDALRNDGAEVIETDISPLLAAAKLLYDGALVAERTYAVGHLLKDRPADADPSVAQIIGSGSSKTAIALVADQQALRRYKLAARAIFETADTLLLPTAPGHPTLAEVATEPIIVNSWVGTYTNFVNLLDLAAVAVPGPDAHGEPFGVTFIGPAFSDAAQFDAASRFMSIIDPVLRATIAERSTLWGPATTTIAVFGAHMENQPLNFQLTSLGARLLGVANTSPHYRFYALDTEPPKPGLVRVSTGGSSITGETWAIPSAHVGTFLSQLARPMVVGKITLDDGREILGFLCEPEAVTGARDITALGGWVAHLRDKKS